MTIVSPVIEYNIRRHLRLGNPKSALWLVDLLLSNHNNPEYTKFTTEYGSHCIDPLLAGVVCIQNQDLGRGEALLLEALRVHTENEYTIPSNQYSMNSSSPQLDGLDSNDDEEEGELQEVLAIHPKCAQCSTIMFMSEVSLPLSSAICPICHDLSDIYTYPRFVQIISMLVNCYIELGQPDRVISLLNQHSIPYEALPYATLVLLFNIYTALHNSTKQLEIAYRMLCLLPDNIELLFQLSQQLDFNALAETSGDNNIIPLFIEYITALSDQYNNITDHFDALRSELTSAQQQLSALQHQPKSNQHTIQRKELENTISDYQLQLDQTTIMEQEIELYQHFFHEQFVVSSDLVATESPDQLDLLNTSSTSKLSRQSQTSISSHTSHTSHTSSMKSLTPAVSKRSSVAHIQLNKPNQNTSTKKTSNATTDDNNKVAKRKSFELQPSNDEYYAETDKENNIKTTNSRQNKRTKLNQTTKSTNNDDVDEIVNVNLNSSSIVNSHADMYHSQHKNLSSTLNLSKTSIHENLNTSLSNSTHSTHLLISNSTKDQNHPLIQSVKWLYHNYAIQSYHYYTQLFKPLALITSQIAQYQYPIAHTLMQQLEHKTVLNYHNTSTQLTTSSQPTLPAAHVYSTYSNSHVFSYILSCIISTNVKETNYTCSILQQSYTQNQYQILGMDYYSFFLCRLVKKQQLNLLYISLRNIAPNRPETAIAKICWTILENKLDLALQLITHLLLQPKNQYYQFGHFLKGHILSLLLRPEALDILNYTKRVFGRTVHIESTICNLLTANRELTLAVNLAHALFEKGKNNPKVLTLLGSLLLQGAVDSWRLKGIQVLNTALALDPTSFLATSLLATYHQNQGDIHQAIGIIEKYNANLSPQQQSTTALSTNQIDVPTSLLNPQAHLTLGKLYLLTANVQGAAREFYTALKIDKDYEPAKVELSTSFLSAVNPSGHPSLDGKLVGDEDEDYESQ